MHSRVTDSFFKFFRRKKDKHNGLSYFVRFTNQNIPPFFGICCFILLFFNFQQPNQEIKAQPELEKQFQADTADAFALLDFADSIFIAGQSKEAIPLHQEAADAFKKCLTGLADSLIWTKNLDCRQKEGISYMNLGDYEKALAIFNENLQKGRALFGENHPSLGESYSNIGAIYYYQSNYPDAVAFMQKGLKNYVTTNGKINKETAMLYGNISILYSFMGQYDSVLIFQEKALEIRNQLFSPPHEDLAKSFHDMANIYLSIGDFEKAEEYAQKALSMRKELFPQGHVDVFYAQNELATSLERQGRYKEAREYYRKSNLGFLSELGEKHIHTIVNFNNLGAVNYKLGAYEKGLEYSSEALELILGVNKNHHRVADIYNVLAKLYDAKKQYSKAIENYKKGLGIQRNRLQPGHVEIARVLQSIGNSWLKMEEVKNATLFYKKAEEELLLSFPSNHPHFATIYERLAAAAFQNKDFDIAIKYNLKGIKIIEEFVDGYSQILSQCHQNLGEIYTSQNQFAQANHAYQKALKIQMPDYHMGENTLFPNVENAKIHSDLEVLSIILRKGILLKKWAENAPDAIEKYKNALAALEFGVKLQEKTRIGYQRNTAKENLLKQTYPIFQTGTEIALRLFEATKSKDYLEKAFYFAEKSKVNLLMESLQNSEAKHFANIPDSLIQKERGLKISLANYETKLQEKAMLESNRDSLNHKIWKQKIIQQKQELDKLIKQFEHDFPNYFQLKYKTKTTDVFSFQKKLNSETALIEYFLGDSALYAFQITRALLHESGLTKKAKFCIFDFTTKQTYKP